MLSDFTDSAAHSYYDKNFEEDNKVHVVTNLAFTCLTKHFQEKNQKYNMTARLFEFRIKAFINVVWIELNKNKIHAQTNVRRF